MEPGWDCTGDGCESVCGDNHQGDEQCDNTNDENCTDCSCPAGYTLNAEDNLCNLCGDGRTTDAEGCDDGNLVPKTGCSTTCTVEGGWDCTGDGCESVCGDNQIVGDEQCDNTNDENCTDCSCPAAIP